MRRRRHCGDAFPRKASVVCPKLLPPELCCATHLAEAPRSVTRLTVELVCTASPHGLVHAAVSRLRTDVSEWGQEELRGSDAPAPTHARAALAHHTSWRHTPHCSLQHTHLLCYHAQPEVAVPLVAHRRGREVRRFQVDSHVVPAALHSGVAPAQRRASEFQGRLGGLQAALRLTLGRATSARDSRRRRRRHLSASCRVSRVWRSCVTHGVACEGR